MTKQGIANSRVNPSTHPGEFVPTIENIAVKLEDDTDLGPRDIKFRTPEKGYFQEGDYIYTVIRASAQQDSATVISDYLIPGARLKTAAEPIPETT